MTTNALSPLALRPLPERGLLRATGAALAAGAYLLCLPWDLRNRTEAPGALQEVTPVTGAGVAALAAVLLLLAASLGACDRLAWTIPLIAAPPVVLLYVSLSTHAAPDASPWPLAWAFFALLIVGGATGAALAGRAVGRWRAGRARP
ncbi:hypothetical protein QIS99_12005 [Streptomyces sp. B-S-A8]|uniref:Integral membrane protein n=1 Tax=Streptomyces solicavernae TaxID=3043614 RepID=A0ABT6RRT2_9ACTN|nr:hypothetical protein [Streptomyces sp. B-S-A8]MDI3386919.1 hypothetical protein [Streptomyces sp. B-S-A8]